LIDAHFDRRQTEDELLHDCGRHCAGFGREETARNREITIACLAFLHRSQLRESQGTADQVWNVKLCGGRTPSRLRRAFVRVVEAAEDGAGPDRAVPRAARRLGRLEPERAVRTFGVVEGSELGQDRPEVPLVDYDEVVAAFPA
jgi:hypothetical protein